jgi:hypothetical protein
MSDAQQVEYIANGTRRNTQHFWRTMLCDSRRG